MLPDLYDQYDTISDEAKLELVAAMVQVFKDLREQDINKITMGELLLMVKPQFEVGRDHIGEGVVRDPELRAASVQRVIASAQDMGAGLQGVLASPLPGPEGNVEYFINEYKMSQKHLDFKSRNASQESESTLQWVENCERRRRRWRRCISNSYTTSRIVRASYFASS